MCGLFSDTQISDFINQTSNHKDVCWVKFWLCHAILTWALQVVSVQVKSWCLYLQYPIDRKLVMPPRYQLRIKSH